MLNIMYKSMKRRMDIICVTLLTCTEDGLVFARTDKACRHVGGNPPKPLKIKPPIADYLYPPRGFKGVEFLKNLAPFEVLTPKGTDAESGFENGTTYLRKVQENKTKMVYSTI